MPLCGIETLWCRFRLALTPGAGGSLHSLSVVCSCRRSCSGSCGSACSGCSRLLWGRCNCLRSFSASCNLAAVSACCDFRSFRIISLPVDLTIALRNILNRIHGLIIVEIIFINPRRLCCYIFFWRVIACLLICTQSFNINTLIISC